MEGKLNRVLSAAVVAVIAFALSLWGNGLGFLLSLSLLCGAVECKLAARALPQQRPASHPAQVRAGHDRAGCDRCGAAVERLSQWAGYLPRLCPAVRRCGVRPVSPFPPVNDLSMR